MIKATNEKGEVIAARHTQNGNTIRAPKLADEAVVLTAAQLDAIVRKAGAGLVVAGAYGHSRFREWVLSGVTRHLVTHSRRCAFLSR